MLFALAVYLIIGSLLATCVLYGYRYSGDSHSADSALEVCIAFALYVVMLLLWPYLLLKYLKMYLDPWE